jgi:DNA mismatch repair ATPase MutS
VLAAHDEKIDSYSTALEEELKKLTGDHDDQDKEMQQLGKNVADCMRELNAKIGKKEAQHIWAHFENYAMYEDFKELYRKTIPELAKFEQQILNFHAEQERARLIIRGFDYAMTGKANKSVMDSISHDVEKNYVRNDDLEQYRKTTEETLKSYEAKIREQQSILEMMSKTLKSQLQRELKTAVAMLKSSAFDDDGGGVLNMTVKPHRNASFVSRKSHDRRPSVDLSIKRTMSLSPKRQ